jgi:hypothetical protein
MVYDAARQVIVMFGGEDENQQPFGDTWEYDGTSWVQRTFTTQPAARTEPAMSYDTDRHVTVLYGGRIPFGLLYGDTWEYDGTKWVYKNKHEQYNPSARSNATMAYDPVHQRTVLFGGYTPLKNYNETWAWDGSHWSQPAPSSSTGLS